MSTVDDASNLRLQLSRLRRDLDAKVDGSEFDALREDVEGQGQELASLSRRADGIEESIETLDRVRHELTTAINRLDRRLQWLDRRARAAAGARIVDLSPTPDLITLAAQAELGEALAAQLLDEHGRAVRAKAVRAWASWQSQYRTHVATALAASKAIAQSVPGSEPRPAAVLRMRAARSEVGSLRERKDAVREAAERAQQELNADDALRLRHADAIAQGRRAWTSLSTRLRSRLGEVIERAEMTPHWFDAELGPGPLGPDTDSWLDTGAQLLAYRATYAVTDETSALGPRPGAGASARRRTWYDELSRTLRRIH